MRWSAIFPYLVMIFHAETFTASWKLQLAEPCVRDCQTCLFFYFFRFLYERRMRFQSKWSGKRQCLNICLFVHTYTNRHTHKHTYTPNSTHKNTHAQNHTDTLSRAVGDAIKHCMIITFTRVLHFYSLFDIDWFGTFPWTLNRVYRRSDCLSYLPCRVFKAASTEAYHKSRLEEDF